MPPPPIFSYRYATFGSLVEPDVLESYPGSSRLVAAARIGVSLIVTMCYPLQSHPTRMCLTSIYHVAAAKMRRRKGAPPHCGSRLALAHGVAAHGRFVDGVGGERVDGLHGISRIRGTVARASSLARRLGRARACRHNKEDKKHPHRALR